jgi:type IV pilus assembly protein PilB
VCPDSKEEYRLSRAEAAPLENPPAGGANFGRVLASLKEEGIVEPSVQWKELLFPRAVACGECDQGYIGLTGLQEILPVTTTIKDMLLRGVPIEDIEMQAREEGMLTIVEDGLFKAVQGITSIEEVFRIAQDR